MIVDILSSHFAIAFENARHYEETKAKSERCALTNLYNYRYIEAKLSEEFSRLQNGQGITYHSSYSISIILKK